MPAPRPELLSLLEACKDAPDDVAPRLVLADWLEEYGEESDRARAEFVRLHCAWSMQPDDPARDGMQQRGEELLAQHGSTWGLPQGGAQTWNEFHRGLPEARLDKTPAPPEHLAGAEASAWVGGIYGSQLETDAIRAMLGSPWLRTVTRLRLWNDRAGDPGATLIADSPAVARLRHLSVSCDYRGLGAAGAAALARSPHLARLHRLSLCGHQIGTIGVAALASSPHLAGLTALDVSSNQIGPDGIEALAASPYLRSLTSLGLSANWVGDGLSALARSPVISGLEQLAMYGCTVDDERLTVLAASPLRGRLASLNVGHNGLRDDGVVALAAAASSARLTKLLLVGNHVKNRGAIALASSPHLAGLRVLTLNGTLIRKIGGAALADSPHLANLVRLDVTGCDIGKDARARLLARYGEQALKPYRETY